MLHFCHSCGGHTRVEKIDFETVYKDVDLVISNVNAHICIECGEKLFDKEAVDTINNEWLKFSLSKKEEVFSE
jgi:YgiT-type zinc finger domain-containing protein